MIAVAALVAVGEAIFGRLVGGLATVEGAIVGVLVTRLVAVRVGVSWVVLTVAVAVGWASVGPADDSRISSGIGGSGVVSSDRWACDVMIASMVASTGTGVPI